MLCYKRLLNDLNSKIGKVEIEEGRVARRVGEAKDDGKIIEDYVVEWQGNVENVKIQADELTRQTSSTTCFKVVNLPNPVSRFRLGRKAAHLAKTVTDHTNTGRELLANEIAHYPPDENVPNSDTPYQSFGSRQEAYDKLWNALVNNDSYPIIGIYGMPGVGKTRMMEEAWKQLKDKKIFDKITRADVGGERLDVIKLQQQLAGYLNCHLESKDNEVKRASQLKSSLMNGGEVLVILDDVWDAIPLNKIGIPFGDGSSKGCKILMTSRKDTVCRNNNCTDPIQIKPLTDGEAWEMFRNKVGTSKIDSLEDPSLAEKVCKECGALPLLIDAVGRALKGSTENFLKDALYQLENSELQEIDGIDTRVYACLKFSFEKLKKGEKACLLLCSFFPEDADIDINILFDMATGSQLLRSGRNIGGLVDSLKSSSLLLEGKDVDTVKVHDVIRDVARSISTREADYAFLSLRCRSRLPDDEDYHTRRLLHLDLEGENVGFPDDLVCSDLDTLWMQSNIHSQQLSCGLFKAFINLKVLLLRGKFLLDHQLTIHNLVKLKVLILEHCKISQTFISSVSRKLETLCIQYCDLPSPVDLPELKNLRKLEILNQQRIEIVEKAISGFSRLEELIVPYGFKTRDNDDDKSISVELSQLGCLRNLVIRMNKLWYYPERDIFSSLVEFNIKVAESGFQMSWDGERKYVYVEGVHVERWWMPLVERAEQLRLYSIIGLPNGLSDSNMEEAFSRLKGMKIAGCDEMEHVASWEGRNKGLQRVTNLNLLKISYCYRLKYVFSSGTDQTKQEIISFPNLKRLTLEHLPSLTSFCGKKVTFPSITRLDIKKLNTIDWLEDIEVGSHDNTSSKLRRLSISSTKSQLLPSQLKLQIQNLKKLVLENCWWSGQDSLFNGSLTFNSLKVLVVAECPEISTLFTTSVFRSLHQLEELKVLDCSLLKEIVGEEDAWNDGTNDKTSNSLLHLHSVSLSGLPNLQNIGISACYMPALVDVYVNKCGLITSLFARSAFRNIQHLQKLKVSGCSLLRDIVEEEEEDARDDGTNDKTPISLLHLWSINLSELPNLQNIGISACCMPALVKVYVSGCGLITSLFTHSAFRNLQHLCELDVSDCSLLKEIVEEEEDARDDGTKDKTPISLLHLQSLSLSELPNLENIGISACYMPELVDVDVNGCGLITHLFTHSAIKNLQHLKELKVSACLLLEEIVEDEIDDVTTAMSEKMISLPRLAIIELEYLPRLRSFGSSSTFTFNMPALDSISLYECPCIKKFTSLPITTPSVNISTDHNNQEVIQRTKRKFKRTKCT